tara:strand:- start:53 stop:556 length:504 start_codon:yes stop_codon:yes gene_type:complete
MKKLIFFLTFIPLLSFSQGNTSNSINWVSLSEGEKYSEKYKKNMLIFFYRDNCEYCMRMKKEVLSDPQIIKLINENFFPVILNGKSKKPITYNGKKYINTVSAKEDSTFRWRHDFAFELIATKNGSITWPSIAILNSQKKKIKTLAGFRSKPQLIRSLTLLAKIKKS